MPLELGAVRRNDNQHSAFSGEIRVNPADTGSPRVPSPVTLAEPPGTIEGWQVSPDRR